MNAQIGSRLGLGFGLALLVLLVNGAIALYNVRALTDYQNQVIHSYSALTHINAVLTLVDDAETGQRGYVLTDRSVYLQPYISAIALLPSQMRDVRAAVADDPVLGRDDARLEPIVAKKIDEMGHTVHLQATHHHKAALRIVNSGLGRRYMRRIRGLVAQMQAEEQKLLTNRTAMAQSHAHSSSATIVVATAANIILLLFVFLLARRAVRQRERVSQERARLLAAAEAARERAEVEQQRATTSAAQQAAILNQIADGIIIADSQGRITSINPAGQRILGTDTVGVPLPDHPSAYHTYSPDGTLYHAEDLPLSRAALQRETLYGVPVVIHRPDGASVYLEVSATPLITDEGVQFGAVANFRDVTLQRDIERQKEEFLSAAAHDLRTPLTTAKALAQLLQRRARREGQIDREALLDGLARIDTTTSHMTAMIDELLDHTRLQMGQSLDLHMRPSDLIPLLQRLVADSQAASRALGGTDGRLRISFHTSLPDLIGTWDIDRLDRVFGNLLSNAVKYSPNGGVITVAAEREEIDGSAYAVVTVSDQGVGIRAEDLPNVFERFQRGSNVRDTIPGTGIGLAGARTIVQEHGGTISVTSREGQGSIFVVRLPLAGPQEEAGRQSPIPAAE